MIINEEDYEASLVTEDDVQDFLGHYGVKGMRWGVRKQRNADIKSARARLQKTGAKIDAQAKRGLSSTSNATKAKAAKEIRNLAKQAQKDPNLDKAMKLTTGEKAAHIVLFGPFAVATIPLTQAGNRSQNRAILEKASKIKVSDF